MKKNHVKLNPKDRDSLETMVSRGRLTAKMFRRATGLLELDRGKTLIAAAETMGVSYLSKTKKSRRSSNRATRRRPKSSDSSRLSRPEI